MKTKFFIFLLFGLFSVQLSSQVTIGSGIPPHSDALLDLKEFTDESSSKGLLMPRVSLVSKASASPLINHVKGMFVYNIADIDTEIYPGCYYNTGTEWVRIETQSGSGIMPIVSNGLSLAGNNIKLGGALSEPTFITGISSANKLSFTGTGVDAINFNNNTLSINATDNRVGIGTNAPLATLHVNGSARITGSTGTSNRIVGRNANGDISTIVPGNGLSLSGNVLTATPGTSTTIYAYLLNYTIRQYNVPNLTTPMIPAANDYTVWVSGNPNVGATGKHIILPVTTLGRVINIVASASDLRVGAAGINGGHGWITTSNGVNDEIFTIPSKKRVSFQYIGGAWDEKGTWVVMMKDF